MSVAAVVLAAGAATRYGAPEAARAAAARCSRRSRRSPVDEVVVVAGAHPLEPDERARLVLAADWDRGPGASLRSGLAALGDDVTHALVVLADGPELDPRAVERLVEHRARRRGRRRQLRRHAQPPGVARAHVWVDVPDDGARALDAALVDCSDLSPPGDVDYPGDRAM